MGTVKVITRGSHYTVGYVIVYQNGSLNNKRYVIVLSLIGNADLFVNQDNRIDDLAVLSNQRGRKTVEGLQ